MAEEQLALPALFLDRQVRVSGPFDVRVLLDAIEAELEMKR